MDNGRTPVVALVGNPNVGKSTLFNAVTGLRQHTGNWPGKTVSAAWGRFRRAGREFALVEPAGDLRPGPPLPRGGGDEGLPGPGGRGRGGGGVRRRVPGAGAGPWCTRCGSSPAGWWCASNLLDEARRRGVTVDLEELSRALGLPAVGTSAGRRQGVEELLDLTAEAALREEAPPPLPPAEPAEHLAAGERAAARAVRRRGDGRALDRRLDRLLTGKYTALPLLALLLLGVLWLTIVGANLPSQLLTGLFARGEAGLNALCAALGAPEWLRGPLVDGAYRVLGWVVSVMLPPMAIFFPLFTLLEDLGYLPRVAFVMDRAFQRCRACGKQALTMCMGLGCNAVGVTGCRIIDSPRERLLAILTNSLMPCNGRFPPPGKGKPRRREGGAIPSGG